MGRYQTQDVISICRIFEPSTREEVYYKSNGVIERNINCIRDIFSSQSENPFIRKRREQNLEPAKVDIYEDQFWNAHLTALLTSQQHSGPDSHVSQFLKEEIHIAGPKSVPERGRRQSIRF